MKAQLFKHYKDVPSTLWRWANFTPKEIACKGTGELLINFDAMDKLQDLRELLGVPFSPNSAYRSINHNRSIGGSAKSMHLHGRAFDIPLSKNIGREALKLVSLKCGFTGLGDYDTFVHVDTGSPRHWDLRTKNK